jgi:SAM-dependent methyltransferase
MPDTDFDRIARFYDAMEENFTQDIPFYVDYAKACGGEVLELACGTGRVLFPVAREGVKITGLDISRGMLDIARKKLAALEKKYRSRVDVIHGDMTNFDLKKKFKLIYIPFRSFQGLLTSEDRDKCLACARGHLAEDGIFILDLFAPIHKYLAQERRREYMGIFTDKESGLPVTNWAETTYDLARQTLKSDWYFEWTDQSGQFQRLVWQLEIAYLFRFEAGLLLEKHGFRVRDVFGGFKKEPYNYYSGEQIFVCEKA